jgi:biofilm PGA synthesis N-glycosyltransferase PgaC
VTPQTQLSAVRHPRLERRLALASISALAIIAVAAAWPIVGPAAGRLRATLRADGATPLAWVVTACLIYLVVVYCFYALLLGFAGVEAAFRARQRSAEDLETLEQSRFTIPVSIIASLYNEEPVAVASVESLLRQSYPEFEVLVIDDGSTDGTFEALRDAFALEPRDVFFRQVVETRPTGGVYRSLSDPRLIVVRKLNGGKADALNTGLNFARYRYVLGVDGDTVYRPDALLSGMRVAMRDPARVVGVTSHVAISVEPEAQHDVERGRRTVDRSLLSNFQHLDYLRSFMNNRLAWSRLGFMLCTVGAFHIWRRDVLEEVGGFSPEFTCEDIEMTFRVHELSRREGRGWQILSLADTVATTEGPSSIGPLIKQRARWQRVIMETVWHYRRMFVNPRYGSVGLVGVPFYFVTEVIAPVFEVAAVAVIVIALWLGVLDALQFGLTLGVMCAVTGILSSIAVLIDDRNARSYRISSLVRLMLVAPLDLFIYRPVLVWARVRGTVDFLRGRRDWDKFERNTRAQQNNPLVEL